MADLSKAELRWLERADDDTGRRPPSASRLIRKATERHQTAAVQVAAALVSATCTVPPQQRGGRTAPGGGRGSDVSDRVLAQIEATVREVDRGLSRLGHLLDHCLACASGPPDPHDPGHNDASTVTLAWLTGESWTWIVDYCVGVSATSPKAVEAAATDAARAHAAGAAVLVERWMDARRNGAEPDVLDGMAQQANRLSLQMVGLADSLGQWRPGPLVRRCAADCGGAAPPVGEGATCQRCRQRFSRSSA